MTATPKHALQRTRPSCSGCNRVSSRAAPHGRNFTGELAGNLVQNFMNAT